jgi:hypothetical protein
MNQEPEEVAVQARTSREVRVDWCEFTVKGLKVEDVFGALVERFGVEFRRELFEVVRDDERRFDARGPLSMRVHADRVGQLDKCGRLRPWSGVKLPGAVCGQVGTAAVLRLLQQLGQPGTDGAGEALKVSRLDLALDDFDRKVSPRQFAEACVLGRLDQERSRLRPEVITRVRRDNWEWSRRSGGCFWLGGRKGPRLLRVYDKQAESSGAIPSVRFELQCRNEFGTKMATDLVGAWEAGESLWPVWAAHVVGFVDLREANGHRSNSAKRRRLGWWQRLVGQSAAATIAAKDDSPFTQWEREMQKQCGGFLLVMLQAEGVDKHGFTQAIRDPEMARRVCSVMARCLGTRSWSLSGVHELRLRQAFEQLGMAKRLGELVRSRLGAG